ncbi:MAG: hypothetical protein HYV97_16530 [Bdellovibrio sp.]|nr:hypothetical protein [Bdellovibrio sp.]
MKNIIMLLLFFVSSVAISATDPCRSYNISTSPSGGCTAHPEAMYCRVRCENGGNYRPSAILDIPDSELSRECKNKILRDFALAMSQSSRNTNGLLRKKFKTFLEENTCVFDEDTTGGSLDDLTQTARSFLSAYWEEAACIDVAAKCRATTISVESGGTSNTVSGIYHDVGGRKYCQLGDLMLDPSCLINTDHAKELATAAKLARSRINSCLANATSGTGVKNAMEKLFTRSVAYRPKHCCGACLQASMPCDTENSSLSNMCAFNCGTNSASVVTYGTHHLGHFADPPSGFVAGGSCARNGSEINKNQSLASTIFHEYLHAIGVCTDSMHNESGRSPFDPIYGCQNFCFQSGNNAKNCIACAMASTGTMQVSTVGSGGAVSTTSSSSPAPADVTRRGNITYESWINYLYGTTAAQPTPTLPQACVGSLKSYIKSRAEGEVGDAVSLFHRCIPDIITDEPETDLRVPPPSGGYAVWSRVYNLRTAGNKCTCDPADPNCHSDGIRDPLTNVEGPKMSATNAFARACTQTTLPDASVESACCRKQREIIQKVTWAAERNRRGCLMYALNTAKVNKGSAMDCYSAAKRECIDNPPHPAWRGHMYDEIGQNYCRDVALNVCHIGQISGDRYTYNIPLGTPAAGLDALGRETERIFNECMATHLPLVSSANLCNVADLPTSVCEDRPVTSFYDRVNRPENTTWGVENALEKAKCVQMSTGRLQSWQNFPPGMPSF